MVAIFIIPKIQKQLECFDEWVDNEDVVYSQWNLVICDKSDIEGVMLGEINQEKDRYTVISFIYGTYRN